MSAAAKLAEYLKDKNKSAFARAIGLTHTGDLYKYLPGRHGAPARRRIGGEMARRIVRAANGDLTFEDLLGAADQEAA